MNRRGFLALFPAAAGVVPLAMKAEAKPEPGAKLADAAGVNNRFLSEFGDLVRAKYARRNVYNAYDPDEPLC